MNTISLVTYHYSANVGAVMQTYALCRFLKENGFKIEVVDIRHLEPTLKTISVGSPLPVRLLKSIIYPRRIKKIMTQYYPAMTKHYKSMEDLRKNPPKSDCYIVGSDQVWNPDISADRALAYFLDFGSDEVRRISYASSFGLSKWKEGKYASTSIVKKCLDKFYNVSVRELEGADILRQTFNIEPTIVVDPTFLNDSYPEITGKVKQRKEIVCYKLEKTQDFWENMPIVSKKMNTPALLLNYNFPKKGYKYHFNPTVNQWVRRIAGASFVVTDSFHGVAFSIIYKREFAAVINHNGKESRIVSLLKILHLENRLFDSVKDLSLSNCWNNPINYAEVYKLLAVQKEISINYLLNALK